MGTELIVPKDNYAFDDYSRSNGFKWTPSRMKAAELIAQNELNFNEIAREVNVSLETIMRWKRSDEFKAKVEYYRNEQELAIRKEGIAKKENRIEAIKERWQKLNDIIKARAETYSKDPELKDVPGIETGLIIKIEKFMGRTREVRYEVDDKVLSYMSKLEEQIAKEVGDQKDVVNNLNLIKTYVGVSLEDL